MFMTVKQAAEKWGVSDRRIRVLCSEGKIAGEDGKFQLMPVNLQMDDTNQRKASFYRLTVRKKNWTVKDH